MNSQYSVANRSAVITAWLAALVCCGVAVLAWFGYRAANEWPRNSEKLIASREIEIGRTFRINVGPDMRAVEAAMLSSPDWEAVSLKPPEEIPERLGRTFSRYSYPEVFFPWRMLSRRCFFVARPDRMSPWLTSTENTANGSVLVTQAPAAEAELTERLVTDLKNGSESSIFECRVHDVRHQVVAREYEIRACLAERHDRVAHRDQLLQQVWGIMDSGALTRSVDFAIARLRKKIEPDPANPSFIRTVHGDGYSLTSDQY